MGKQRKPILCLDFDGVLHSYTSGWQGVDVVGDPPVPGALEFLQQAVAHFSVHVYSSRSGQAGGIVTMQDWLIDHFTQSGLPAQEAVDFVYDRLQWPTEKPPALVTIDDRVVCFDGTWPDLGELLAFRPWNKR